MTDPLPSGGWLPVRWVESGDGGLVSVIELDYVELGVAWQRSRLPSLSPIFTWRNRATVPDDPQRALDDAETRLRSRGLIERRGELDDDLYGVLALFAQAPYELDLRFAPGPGQEIRACVAGRAGHAVRAIVDGERVRVQAIPDYSITASLIVPTMESLATSYPEPVSSKITEATYELQELVWRCVAVDEAGS